jgi:hypothetical protein
MSIGPRSRFERGLADVDRLMEIHTELGGPDRGYRAGLEPLNRSAVVLLTAVWEGFVEDAAAQALERLVGAAKTPDKLPLLLRTTVAKEIKDDPHNLASWKLAGNRWQPYLRGRLDDYAKARARGLITPDSTRVEALFKHAVGLEHITDAWRWQSMTQARAKDKLDEMIRRRGDIAHGGEPAGPSKVQRAEVRRHKDHVVHLVDATELKVNAFLHANGAASL